MANMPQQSILDGLSWGDQTGPSGLLDSLPPWMRETIAGVQGSMPPNGIALQGYGQFPGGGPPHGGGAGPGMQQPNPAPQPQQQPEGYYGGSPETNPRLNPATYGNYPAQSIGDRALGVAGQVGNRLLGAMNGFANAGSLPSAIANGITTLATGKATDPNEIGQQATNQKLSAVYQAFREAGQPHAAAMAAAMSPEVAKIIGPEAFGPDKWGVVGKDMLGNEQYGFINNQKRTITQPVGGAPGGAPSGPGGQTLEGPALLDYLKKKSPADASMIEAIIRGDASVTGRNLQKYMPVATLVDPTLSQFNYDTRKKTALDFAPGGKSANNVKSLETIGGHIEKLMTNFDKMGNGRFPLVNLAGNMFTEALGGGAPGAYETTVNGVANELGTVFRSFGMSDAEVHSWRNIMTSSKSPEQFKANMSTILDMLKTRKEAIEEQHQTGLGKPMNPASFAKLNAAIGRIEKAVSLPEPGQETAPSGPPPPQAVSALKANPKLADQFDAKYGIGASARALGVLR